MEANELKIGNLVYTKTVSMDMNGTKFGQAETVVKGITETGITPYLFKGAYVTEMRDEHLLSNLEPIPLTDEWLHKLGFEHPKGDTNTENAFVKNDVIIYKSIDQYRLGVFQNAIYDDTVGPKYYEPTPFIILTVHGLQNMFHSLTGLELIQLSGAHV